MTVMIERYADTQFLPDTILPAQWHTPALATRLEKSGELRLLYALVEDAINCFTIYAQTEKKHDRRLHQEAADWLLADDPLWAFSSTNVLLGLGINPDVLRRKLRAWLAERKPEQPERPIVIEVVPPLEPSPYGGRPPTATTRYRFRQRRLPGSPYYNLYVIDHEEGRTYHLGTFADSPKMRRIKERFTSNPDKYGPRYIAGLTDVHHARKERDARHTTAPAGGDRGGDRERRNEREQRLG